ncbi:MAG: hypothetical protein R3F43_21755 [bacterium]
MGEAIAGWPALRDLTPGSPFLRAVNDAPLPDTTDLTSIYTCADEYIRPVGRRSSRRRPTSSCVTGPSALRDLLRSRRGTDHAAGAGEAHHQPAAPSSGRMRGPGRSPSRSGEPVEEPEDPAASPPSRPTTRSTSRPSRCPRLVEGGRARAADGRGASSAPRRLEKWIRPVVCTCGWTPTTPAPRAAAPSRVDREVPAALGLLALVAVRRRRRAAIRP